MSLFELTLQQFLFPNDLPNDKANFRFVVDLRYIAEKCRFTTEHAVMPSLDTFWECDTGRKDAPNYVRKHDGGNGKPLPEFDFDDKHKIDHWDRLILHVKGESLHSIQFKVIDVNRKDAWDKVKPFLKGIVEAVIGKIKGIIPESLPLSLPESLEELPTMCNPFSLRSSPEVIRSCSEDRANSKSVQRIQTEMGNRRNSRSRATAQARKQKETTRSVSVCAEDRRSETSALWRFSASGFPSDADWRG